MASFKGTVFESLRMFTEREFGSDAFERILSELPDEDRALLVEVNALGWYPVEPVLRYHHALERVFGSGDFSLCERAGRFSAGWAMNTVLKVFLRFRSPQWLVGRATSVWGRYHDSGQWEVTAPAQNRIRGVLTDFAVRDLAFCARLRGFLGGMVELTGGRGAVVTEVACAARGGQACQFNMTWRK